MDIINVVYVQPITCETYISKSTQVFGHNIAS